MAQEWAKPFYNSVQWQSARRLVLGRSGGLCERCFAKGIIRSADVVHHRIPLTPMNIINPEITLNPKLLQALCSDCHAEVHSSRPSRRYEVTEDGEVRIDPPGPL